MTDKIGRGRNRPAHTQKTKERVFAMEAGGFNEMSVELAKLCVLTKITASDVAKITGVTRGAVYRWMQGRKIKEERRPQVKKFMDTARDAFELGELPKINRIETAKFVDKLCPPAQ